VEIRGTKRNNVDVRNSKNAVINSRHFSLTVNWIVSNLVEVWRSRDAWFRNG